MDANQNNTKMVLWTGGWDSSFRIVQLSRMEGIAVQGVYVVGDGRPSEKREIRAINEIIDALRAKPETKAQILPLKIIEKSEIPENSAVTAAYNKIRGMAKIGTQYEWLGRYAILHPGIELGAILPDGEFSGFREVIEKNGGFVNTGDTYVLNVTSASEDCKTLFGSYSCPLAFTKESSMVEMVKDWGYEDVMALIWFCHRPIKGRPCGICRPCEQKMEGNMEFLLPKDAQRRYRCTKVLRGIFGENGRRFMYKVAKIQSRR